MLNRKFSALIVLTLAAVVTASPVEGPVLLAEKRNAADPVDVGEINIMRQRRDDSASVPVDQPLISLPKAEEGAEGLADGGRLDQCSCECTRIWVDQPLISLCKPEEGAEGLVEGKFISYRRDASASVPAEEGAEGLADGWFVSYRMDASTSVPAEKDAEGLADGVSVPTAKSIGSPPTVGTPRPVFRLRKVPKGSLMGADYRESHSQYTFQYAFVASKKFIEQNRVKVLHTQPNTDLTEYGDAKRGVG
ncbi:hypothetical protein C8R45DRAFT_937056 [Mycena sanguinolenta]|nr:hypothetical protein C8R45DRAFT_937056 [Mycena sanguinolenta]